MRRLQLIDLVCLSVSDLILAAFIYDLNYPNLSRQLSGLHSFQGFGSASFSAVSPDSHYVFMTLP